MTPGLLAGLESPLTPLGASPQQATTDDQESEQNRGRLPVGGGGDHAGGMSEPPTGRDVRHGAAVNLVRPGVPLSEVQQQLGHARIDSTTIYTKLANPERRRLADRVAW